MVSPSTPHPDREQLPLSQTLSLRRIYIIPTRQGLAFAITTIVMLAGSANYNNSLGYLLSFLLISLALVSMLHAFHNMHGLRVTLGRIEPVFVGEKASVPIIIHNDRAIARHTLTISHSPRSAGRKHTDMVMTDTRVSARNSITVHIPVAAKQRGFLSLGRMVLSTRYPLGLFYAWSILKLRYNGVVYPRPGGDQPLPLDTIEATEQGNASGTGQDDFDGFRNYVPGDSPRRLYWKAEAREQGLMVKQFNGGASGHLLLHWNDVRATDTELRLGQLCQWLLQADAQQLNYGLELPGQQLPIASGTSHLRQCLETLALHNKT